MSLGIWKRTWLRASAGTGVCLVLSSFIYAFSFETDQGMGDRAFLGLAFGFMGLLISPFLTLPGVLASRAANSFSVLASVSKKEQLGIALGAAVLCNGILLIAGKVLTNDVLFTVPTVWGTLLSAIIATANAVYFVYVDKPYDAAYDDRAHQKEKTEAQQNRVSYAQLIWIWTWTILLGSFILSYFMNSVDSELEARQLSDHFALTLIASFISGLCSLPWVFMCYAVITNSNTHQGNTRKWLMITQLGFASLPIVVYLFDAIAYGDWTNPSGFVIVIIPYALAGTLVTIMSLYSYKGSWVENILERMTG